MSTHKQFCCRMGTQERTYHLLKKYRLKKKKSLIYSETLKKLQLPTPSGNYATKGIKQTLKTYGYLIRNLRSDSRTIRERFLPEYCTVSLLTY